MKTIYLAGGCFWGMQKFFDQFDFVQETRVGYANGYTMNPEYKDVKAQITGYAETLMVVYEDDLSSLLDFYFEVIDPTSVNKQGEDEGSSYRTGIYYIDDSDLPIINQKIAEIAKKYDKPIVVEVEPLKNFYDAEEYHQKYLEKNPGGYCHIPSSLFTKYK
ncbi:peptide-methionine (S)-S-oxide reductase MsrA [Floccifex sp.]|uniref:peptide-methionine (S)-S-oxide reductase MsrA n=1 Tax=Floccifex sp. TaxID=2815810 RepID=UPI002A752F3E|nr:peptide-methionine (S)-S-oxide reductase MsrA [Floccifex sp.]MDD7280652.1 peptide-methionine (S)-S-oxide reductase MsrA [Erysipelotrichaceae bacterium]MDY2958025.1 peptide-methionine (S)-S-oxide reductase MsrA [Floccifex sp.]